MAKIVLILGAGASIPFGMPSGKSLIQHITISLKFIPKKIYKAGAGYGVSDLLGGLSYDDSQSDNELFSMMMEVGFTKNRIELFRESLRKSQINSVDAFLEHRTEFIPIGKMAIAYNLLKLEKNSEERFTESPDWYNYLWNKLISKVSDFPKNDVAIITFNYDRTLEYFIHTSFKALYGLEGASALQLLDKIEIVQNIENVFIRIHRL